MPLKNIFTSVFIIIVFLLIFPILTHAQSPSSLDCNNGFSNLFSGRAGITYKQVTFSSPRTIPAHIVKVDLNNSNIDTATTPRVWLGNTTSAFRSLSDAAIAINGSGFDTIINPQGYNASKGDVYSGSPSDGGLTYSSSEDNSEENIDYTTTQPVWDVISGVNTLVENGNVRDKLISCTNPNSTTCNATDCDSYCTMRARTSIGITSNHQLIIIVTEEGSSQLLDIAEMMAQCGAETAINMDGGGSTTLAADPSNITGRAIINNLAGSERVVANHLAICFGSCTIPNPIDNQYRPEGNPIPKPYVPCNDTRDPEFHSLRPYQASPCNLNKEDLALFCGNDLFVGDNITISKEADPDNNSYKNGGSDIFPNPPVNTLSSNLCQYCGSNGPGECIARPAPCIPEAICGANCWPYNCTDTVNCGWCEQSEDARTETCAFTLTGNKDITVDLSGAKFPIMGYTEPSKDNEGTTQYKVINSVNEEEENMDNATKMNNYVSWYLNGVTGRAEYPYNNPKLECVGESTGKVGSCMETRIGSDGGVQCLGNFGIPFIAPSVEENLLADGKSVCTGLNAYCCVSKVFSTSPENTPGSITTVNYSGPIKKLLPFTLQSSERINQVNDAESSVNDNAKIRHNQYIACHSNIFATLLGFGDADNWTMPLKCYGDDLWGISIDWLKTKLRLTEYVGKTPPVEEDPNYLGEDYNKWVADYKSWRGYTCLTIPVIVLGQNLSFNLCFDNPLKPNFLGNLFSYVPFSSTEDRMGDVKIKDAAATLFSYSPFVRILWSEVIPLQNADLFVPHMEEDTQLAALLQKMFAYKDADLTSMQNSGFIPDSPYCEFREVRSNPGDELFAGDLKAQADYTAELTCKFLNWGGSTVHGGGVTPPGNLCENQIGGSCIPLPPDSNHLYTESVYGLPPSGYFDCGSNSLCVVGTSVRYDPPPLPTGCELNPEMVCVPINFTGSGCDGPLTCGNDYFKCVAREAVCTRPFTEVSPQYCSESVYINLKLEDRTPLADEAWTRLVAGSAGVFRKMLPQIGGEYSTHDGIIDIPASTDVSYTSENGDVLVGDPSGQNTSGQAQLYFPHIGGISEYFLTGIQTLLRPKGMGEQPVFCIGDECKEGDGTLGDTADPGTCESPCTLSCNNNAISMLSPGTKEIIRTKFLDLAARWSGGCTGSPRINLFDEVYDSALQRGVNPVFAIAIWLHESGASNYQCICQVQGGLDPNSLYCQRAYDFGVARDGYETTYHLVGNQVVVNLDRFDKQLSAFLSLPSYYLTYCQSSSFACMWEQFGAIYYPGVCSTSCMGNNYILGIREIYSWLAGSLDFPCYPISI